MTPLYAMAEFVIYSSYSSVAGQPIESLTWTSEGLSGEFTYDLTSGGEVVVPTLAGNTVTTEVSDLSIPSVSGVVKVYMAVSPGTHSGQLVIRTGAGELTVAVGERDFSRAAITPVEILLQGSMVTAPESFEGLEGFEW